MCFSAPVSLAAFITGMTFSYLLYLDNDVSYKIIGIFFGFVVIMQLIEFLLWTHQICDLYNKTVSVIGMILNYTQPIVLGILLLYFYKNMPKLNNKTIKIILIVYTISFVLYISQFIYEKHKCTVKKDNPYLLWNWLQMPYNDIINTLHILTMILLIAIGLPNKITALVVILLGTITLLTSIKYYSRPFVGAIWCVFTAFIPMIIYLYKQIKM
jgi:hypothetical protein